MENVNISLYVRNSTVLRSNSTYVGFDNPFKKTHIRVIFIICYAVVFAMCIFGNAMVLFAIARSPRLRSMTNFFLANLAVADFCVGAFCVLPNLSTFLQPNWVLGKAMCKIYYYIWNVSYTASIIILTVIAVERYIAIIHPLKARHFMTNTKLKVVQLIIWIIAFLYNIPYLFFYDTFTFSFADISKQYCYSDLDNLYSLKILSLVNIILWYLIPLLLVGFLYYRVAVALWKTTIVSALRLQQYPEKDTGSFRSTSTRYSKCDHDASIRRSHTNRCKSVTYDTRQSIKESVSNQSNSSKNTTLYKGNREGTSVISEKNKKDICAENEVKCLFQSTSDPDPYDESGSALQLYELDPNESSHMNNGHRSTPQINSNGHKSHANKSNYCYRQAYLPSTKRVSKARKKVIRLLVAVVVTFGICVLPHMMKVLNHYWQIVTVPQSLDVIISPVSFVVLYLNSALNPILYALFSNTFRRSFRESLHCFRQRQRKRAIKF